MNDSSSELDFPWKSHRHARQQTRSRFPGWIKAGGCWSAATGV